MNKSEEKELEKLLANTLSYKFQELQNIVDDFKACLGKEVKTFGVRLKNLIKGII